MVVLDRHPYMTILGSCNDYDIDDEYRRVSIICIASE